MHTDDTNDHIFLDRHEYGIVMLKPNDDKFEIDSLLYAQIEQYDLEKVDARVCKISSDDVKCNFATKFDLEEYGKFLSKKPAEVILLVGENTNAKLRKLKLAIRRAFGKDPYDMNNLVHTVDLGMEYFKQFPLFFPHHLIDAHSGYADLTVKFENGISAAGLDKIQQATNLSVIGCELEYENDMSEIKEYYRINRERGSRQLRILPYVKSTYKYGSISLPIIHYFVNLPKSNDINELKNSTMHLNLSDVNRKEIKVLDYLPLQIITPEMLLEIKALGVQGIVLHDPRRSLYDTMLLEKMVTDVTKLNTIGGTAGLLIPSRIAIGRADYLSFINSPCSRGIEY